jgi:hypothetical protein
MILSRQYGFISIQKQREYLYTIYEEGIDFIHL